MTVNIGQKGVARLRAAKNIAFIALFLLLTWLPTLDNYLALDHAPQPNEKRAPAPFPQFKATRAGAREFFAGLETYYTDHFGFRKRLIRWNNHWKRQVFRESTISVVMEGKGGWYFYASDKMIEHASGQIRFDDDTLRAWSDLLEARRDWLAKRGIAYLFVVPPDKHTVYPEFLPDWIYSGGSPTKLAQFVDFMKAHSTVPILDLRPVLTEAKQKARVYQFTDTHWTPEGGFVTYQALVRELARQRPGLEPLDSSQFSRATISKPGGDLATLMGQEGLIEKDYVTLAPIPPLESVPLATDAAILPKDWGKNPEPRVTDNPKASGKVILFRDSFAGSWVPFLSHHFNRVIYIWQYDWDSAFIQREKPDVVIDEILERFLNQWDPRELKKRDALK
jgi:alginate O-acetyltransferase complex protein AlgJ